MVRNQAIPRNLDVEGFRVKVSYYGQAVECDNCERLGHFARDCPLKENDCGVTNLGTLQESALTRVPIPLIYLMMAPLIRHWSLLLVRWLNLHPLADSNNVSNDSATSVSSRVLFDSVDVGTAMERTFRMLVFPVATMISRIHLALI